MKRNKIQMVEKKRAEMAIFIEESQYPQCVKHHARAFLLAISMNSPNNTKRVIL